MGRIREEKAGNRLPYSRICDERTILLREKDLPWRERTAIATELASLLYPFGGTVTPG